MDTSGNEMFSIPLTGVGVPDLDITGLSGIFSAEQIQEKLRPLRETEGVECSTLQTTIAHPGDQAIVCTQLKNRPRPELPASLDAKFSVPPSDLKRCRLYSEINLEQPAEDNPSTIATQQMSSTTYLNFGQTLGLGSFKQDAAHEILIFVTPALPNSIANQLRK